MVVTTPPFEAETCAAPKEPRAVSLTVTTSVGGGPADCLIVAVTGPTPAGGHAAGLPAVASSRVGSGTGEITAFAKTP